MYSNRCNCACQNNNLNKEKICSSTKKLNNNNLNNSNCSNMNNNMVNNSNINMMNNSEESVCGFNQRDVFPLNYMYGQSYVPIQYMDSTFRPEVGLKMGSIFPELISPYEPGQNMEEMEFLRNN